jgi:membrane associated rhomboid family serine protease
MPLLTAATLTITAGFTASRLAGHGLERTLRRDPVEMIHGQVWRLFSPTLVQTDHSVAVVIAALAGCAAVGALGEQVFSRARWLGLYFLGALVGHGLGEVFQPYQGGTSVAFAAVLGGLASHALARGADLPKPIRIEAALAIAGAVLDTCLRDIHGLPFLAGLALAALWMRRDASPGHQLNPQLQGGEEPCSQ